MVMVMGWWESDGLISCIHSFFLCQESWSVVLGGKGYDSYAWELYLYLYTYKYIYSYGCFSDPNPFFFDFDFEAERMYG